MITKFRSPTNHKTHEQLERIYRQDKKIGTLVLFAALFLISMALSFSIFGSRSDREQFTTDVTPKHVQVGSIEDHSMRM